MPRVHRIEKARPAKRSRSCRGCGKEIEVGQSFYKWEKRYGGPQYCHTDCGYPKPTWLSNRKTAAVEEAVLDIDVSGWSPGMLADLLGVEYGEPVGDEVESIDIEVDSLYDTLSPVADTADEVADEYESSADNMPESLQYGYQAEAMRDVAERLREWAENMRSGDIDGTLYLPEREPGDDGEIDWHAWWTEATDALDNKVSEMVGEAEELTNDMPEYEG